MSRRSIVLGGTTTSVFLEDEFWKEIDNRSQKQGAQWYELVREMLDGIEDPKNRSSAIKETLIRTLRDECEKAQHSGADIELKVSESGDTKTIKVSGMRLLIGRADECEIKLSGTDISRRHAMLTFDTTKWWLIDLESKNGTKLNNKKVKSSSVEPGDVIKLGKAALELL